MPQGPLSRGIPPAYGKTVLRSLPCNPSQLFVYWELPQTSVSCTEIRIRLYETIRGGEKMKPVPVLEVPVLKDQQSCYITVPTAGIPYTVELTVTYADKSRSRISAAAVHLPQAIPAPSAPGPEPSPPPAATVPEELNAAAPHRIENEDRSMAVQPPVSPPSSWPQGR